MIRRFLPWVALAAVVTGTLVVGAISGRPDPTPAARAHRISAALRCPVCQGLSVADSPSSTARSIAADVRRRIDEGQSDGEIRQAYVDRFGEWILLQPEGSGFGAVVWALPVAGLVLGGGALALAFRRWRRQPALEPTDDDRALVEQALAGGSGGSPRAADVPTEEA
jgi:cytochrome c-type biogenesis protein CcmH